MIITAVAKFLYRNDNAQPSPLTSEMRRLVSQLRRDVYGLVLERVHAQVRVRSIHRSIPRATARSHAHRSIKTYVWPGARMQSMETVQRVKMALPVMIARLLCAQPPPSSTAAQDAYERTTQAITSAGAVACACGTAGL